MITDFHLFLVAGAIIAGHVIVLIARLQVQLFAQLRRWLRYLTLGMTWWQPGYQIRRPVPVIVLSTANRSQMHRDEWWEVNVDQYIERRKISLWKNVEKFTIQDHKQLSRFLVRDTSEPTSSAASYICRKAACVPVPIILYISWYIRDKYCIYWDIRYNPK